MHICFVTYNEYPEITPDDQLLADYLKANGIAVSPAPWNDSSINWAEFDVVVLRSTWDYHTKIEEFNAWLEKLRLLGCNVLNPVPVIKWNQNKKYLADLYTNRKRVPPFVFCAQNSNVNLKHLLALNNWAKAVIKPAVSGGSFNTWTALAPVNVFDESAFKKMLGSGDMIVQKFMDEIVEQGELSLMFFNKTYSHAVLKKAKQGDFRVQSKFGGTVEIVEPAEHIIQYAASLLDDIEYPLLYARVDGVISGGEFYLMELELIEPALFIAYDKYACEKFYKAFKELAFKNGLIV